MTAGLLYGALLRLKEESMPKFDYQEVNNLASRVSFKEGKTSQTSIGNIRELLGVLADISYEEPEVLDMLFRYGEHRKKVQ